MQPNSALLAVVLLPLALASAGCGRSVHTESRTLSESVSYDNPENQDRLKQALSAAGIPYDVVIEQRNQEFVRWDVSHSKTVERIQDSLFAPPGRSISLDDERQSRFKAWLEQRGIPYRTMVEDQREYIVWDEADAGRVRAWEEFPSYFDNPPISPRQ